MKHFTFTSNNAPLQTGKAVCVGRNYMDHIEELNNSVPTDPLLFIKPASAFCDLAAPFCIPTADGECHNELEIALLVGRTLTNVTESEAMQGIIGVGLALDLTLRDKQTELKSKGYPWEIAKAFDNSCPVSSFIPVEEVSDIQDLHFSLQVNGEYRQQGHTALMIRQAASLISYISRYFTLEAGDLVLTGTPKGVGPLRPGDKLTCKLNDYFTISTQVSQDDS